MNFKIICATKLSESDFFKNSLLGIYLRKYKPNKNIQLNLYHSNTKGLPNIYNSAIRTNSSECCMIFVHDDIAFLDFYWPQRILKLLSDYHLIGVAGNIRRINFQPSWAFTEINGDFDKLNIRGIVGHGKYFPSENISFYGDAPSEVKLLDGCFLAILNSTLQSNQINFDEQFNFNFYDLDFCRSIELAGLKIGVGDISVLHQSSGKYYDSAWMDEYKKYINKWKT